MYGGIVSRSFLSPLIFLVVGGSTKGTQQQYYAQAHVDFYFFAGGRGAREKGGLLT